MSRDIVRRTVTVPNMKKVSHFWETDGTTVDVDVTIDVGDLAEAVARRAVRSTRGRATAQNGRVKAATHLPLRVGKSR